MNEVATPMPDGDTNNTNNSSAINNTNNTNTSSVINNTNNTNTQLNSNSSTTNKNSATELTNNSSTTNQINNSPLVDKNSASEIPETMPMSSQKLSRAQSENLDLNMPQSVASPATVVNNNSVSSSEMSTLTIPMPSVRNQEPTFANMILYSTRVV